MTFSASKNVMKALFHRVGTSQLVNTINQWTVFYMMERRLNPADVNPDFFNTCRNQETDSRCKSTDWFTMETMALNWLNKVVDCSISLYCFFASYRLVFHPVL